MDALCVGCIAIGRVNMTEKEQFGKEIRTILGVLYPVGR